jgi:hypothetical protein
MYLFIGGLGTSEVFVVLFFVGLIVYSLIDILGGNFRDSTTKLIWLLVVLLMPLLGSVLYFAIGRNQKIRKPNKI